jgi:hypothetical protein
LDLKLKPKGGRLTFRDNITQNRFDHPKFDANASILMLMPHKFGVNASNLVLIPKKTVVEATTILFFLKSCFI